MTDRPRNERKLRLVDDAGSSPSARYDRMRRRATHVLSVLGVLIVANIAAAVYFVAHVDELRSYADANIHQRSKVQTRRGDVLDRHGIVLVTDLRSDSVFADPRWVRPNGTSPNTLPTSSSEVKKLKDEVARTVAKITGAPRADVRARLARKTGFVYLTKHIDVLASRELRRKMSEGKLPGVKIEEAFARYYPKGKLAGVLLGRRGWSGSIEASYDSLLSGQQVEVLAYKDRHRARLFFDGAPDPEHYGGQSIRLALDEKIQGVAERELEKGVKDAKADKGVAVVLSVPSAEVLAWAVSPGFDPNDKKTKRRSWLNPVVQEQFEPGSTLKVITAAAALEEKKVTLNTKFNVEGGFKTRGKTIRDSHPARDEHWHILHVLTVAQIIQHSSNVGISKVAMRLGKKKLYRYLRAFGFGGPTESGLSGEIQGQLTSPEHWSLVRLANIAFGQGIAVTALQIATAFHVIAAGGIYRRPRLLKALMRPDEAQSERTFAQEKGRVVISPRIAKRLLKAMRLVCGPGGTAKRARLPDYSVAGKTGTAQQVEPGKGYSDTHWVASFVGITPAEKPRLVIFVAVDTPRKMHPRIPDKVVRTGGAIAAPIFREIARFSLPYLGVSPSPGAPWLAENHPDKARKKAAKAKEALLAQQKKNAQVAQQALEVEQSERRDEPTGSEMCRVPQLRGQSMRVVRETLAARELALWPLGSGVAFRQVPKAGAFVRRGSKIKVFFRRFSELASVGVDAGGQP